MRATIQILFAGLSILMLSGCAAIGSRCLHRPCNEECARSFDSPSPFATAMTRKPTLVERVRSKLWDRDEAPRDVTVRPEETPLPGAQLVRKPPVDGVLDLPSAADEDSRED